MASIPRSAHRPRRAARLIPSNLVAAMMVLMASAVPLLRAETPPAQSPRGEVLVAKAPVRAAHHLEAPVRLGTAFLSANCYDCHQGDGAEAGLDLAALPFDLADADVERRWVRIFDRVTNGEMPPPDFAEVDASEAAEFLHVTGDWLVASQRSRDSQLGRVRARRLTRREVERSLHDLLGIDVPLVDQLPEESQSSEFSTLVDGQSISHFQLERHLAAVDVALDEAFRRAASADEDHYARDFDARQLARSPRVRRNREPELIDGRAVVWSGGLAFYGQVPATTSREDGWYRFRIRASGLKLPDSGGVWATVRSGRCVSSAPLLAWVGAFEAGEQLEEHEFVTWLPRGHMLEIRPGDSTLRQARFRIGQVENGEGGAQDVPGIAIESVTMERVHLGPDNDGVRRLLFGDAPRARKSGQAAADRTIAERLLVDFARRAFRRPITRDEIAGYLSIAHAALDEGQGLEAALRVGYRAILCSPRFLYLTESPGRLDDHAIAARLSYMLRGTTPDERLSQLADAGRLHSAAAIREEVDRLLSDDGARVFVEDFAAEWLDLDQIDFTEPDRKLFRDFDAIVQNTMLDETHTFLETMIEENLSVSHLIDSDFTFLNSRLARFYDIDGVTGDALCRVALEPDDRRGGVLTHGAILKVTANGSNTSPVVRGVWIAERLLGEDVPPPPDNVPAIEPDIRGATTIREMLAKHRSDQSCASCHKTIDPPGFALENYDPAGQWREHYTKVSRGGRRQGTEIDASYVLRDGRAFDDVDDFRELVVSEPHKLARNVAEKLLVFGAGAPISFADRRAIDAIVERAAAEGYGLRSIVHAVAASDVFLSK